MDFPASSCCAFICPLHDGQTLDLRKFRFRDQPRALLRASVLAQNESETGARGSSEEAIDTIGAPPGVFEEGR
ncbi:unnamed protein product [Protopolystoma xenopodis]|uniref:Uncharacterized protein n=1 Tax=Protopolystoma xenopodis TaxID=117903 RepID=A0A448WGN0_9PLAT|nr:unnamed protein product [Protopolystoma xenopodis]